MAANEDCIKVLMLGAKRTGKTTLLASMVTEMTHGSVKELIDITDVTPYAPDEEKLHDKVAELEKVCKSCADREITLDTGATNLFHDYTLKISIPGYKGETKLLFTDGNGEFFEAANMRGEELKQKIATYDILVITIDATFLMGSADKEDTLCTNSINKAYNQVPNCHTLLQAVDDFEGKMARQVLFVPVKAEKWLQRGEFDRVVKRVEEVYDTPLTALKAYGNVEVSILPVQTVGAMSFTCHRKARILTRDGRSRKCSPLDEFGERLIFADGSRGDALDSDLLQRDSRAVVSGLECPYSWFRVDKSGFRPQGCDLLAFQVLRFALEKTLEAKDRENRKDKKSGGLLSLKNIFRAAVVVGFGIPGLLALVAFSFLKKQFGTLNLDALKDSLKKIEEQIAKRPDQIKILKKRK